MSTSAALGSLHRVAGAADQIALTFDDGPSPDATPRLLDILAARSARATFFVLVDPAEQHEHLVARIVAEGHEVALHGRDHRRLTELDGPVLDEHLREGRDRLEQVVGAAVRWIRPPFGAQTVRTFRAIRRAGLAPVVWNRDLQDWVDQRPEDIATRAGAEIEPGDIVLLHELLADDTGSVPRTHFDRPRAAELVLARLAQRGLASTTVGDLAHRGRAVRTAWFRP